MSEASQASAGAGLLDLEETPSDNILAKSKRADYELEFIRKLHIQAIVQADRAQGLNDALLKQIASHLKLLDLQLKLWSWLRKEDDTGLASAAPLYDLWQILLEIPELGEILSRREVREQILAKLSSKENQEENFTTETPLGLSSGRRQRAQSSR